MPIESTSSQVTPLVVFFPPEQSTYLEAEMIQFTFQTGADLNAQLSKRLNQIAMEQRVMQVLKSLQLGKLKPVFIFQDVRMGLGAPELIITIHIDNSYRTRSKCSGLESAVFKALSVTNWLENDHDSLHKIFEDREGQDAKVVIEVVPTGLNHADE